MFPASTLILDDYSFVQREILTWKYLGLAIILFLAGLQSVPSDLYEAAQLDGATWWQVQRRISIPETTSRSTMEASSAERT